MNEQILNQFWEQYKEYFKLPIQKHEEKYKWNVLNQVYSKWNWSRVDKSQMFKESFTINGYNNLWSSGNFYPVDHTYWMFDQFPDETSKIFDVLFDETIELESRIEQFIHFYDEKLPILQSLLPDKKIRNHYHKDRRAIALYLSLQFPEKYFLYKFGMIQSFAQKLGLARFIKGRKENLFRFYELANEVLAFIQRDVKFLEEYHQFCSLSENYSDDSLHLLVQDFIYSIANHFTIVDSSNYSNVWLYSPGEQAYLWEEFYKDKVMALGWDFLGDLERYESKNELNDAFVEYHQKEGNYTNNVKANFEFSAEMEINDLVIVVKGKNNFLGFGMIQSAYYFDNQVKNFKSRRKVNWIKKGNWNNSILKPPIKTLTKLTSKDIIDQILSLLNISDKNRFFNNKLNPMPLNQILYGPPGTGKTYSTIDIVVSLCEPIEYEKNNHESNKLIYDKLLKEGRVLFTTFHQSLAYEDFIEGIKPQNPSQDELFLKYNIEDGLFKIACANAGYLCYLKSESSKNIKSNYSFDELYDAFLAHYQELLNKNESFVFKTLTGKDVTIIHINSNDSIKARAINSVAKRNPAPLTKENIQKLYDRFQNIEEINNLQQVQETVEVTPRTTEFYAVFKALKEFEAENFNPENSENTSFTESIEESEKLVKFNAGVYKTAIKEFGQLSEPVVLVIDEINRGNVSAIFGELITLIEDDKRIGKSETIEVTLPYSKQKFGVPQNLYIIGTMNTADRSVEALDTALRRRFSFVEMLPDPMKIKTDGKAVDGKVAEIDLVELLTIINKRIEVLVDRDHTIGHAFFMNVKTLDDLRLVFKNKIIPLLQEYFYGDYHKIELIIGEEFFSKPQIKNIKFAAKTDSIDREGVVYHLIDISNKSIISDEMFVAMLAKIIDGVE